MKKILFVILHGEVYKDRYHSIKNTWGKHVDTLFYSDYENLEQNIVKVSDNKTYSSNEEKHINVIKNLENFVNNDYEWFFFCDDDTFVNVSMLEKKLNDFDPNYVHGSVINCWPSDRLLSYCSGGAGYLIHNTLLSKIKLNLKNYNTGYSDVSLGLSLRENGVKVLNHELFNSQAPSFYGFGVDSIKKLITFHYIKSEQDMLKLLNNI